MFGAGGADVAHAAEHEHQVLFTRRENHVVPVDQVQPVVDEDVPEVRVPVADHPRPARLRRTGGQQVLDGVLVVLPDRAELLLDLVLRRLRSRSRVRSLSAIAGSFASM